MQTEVMTAEACRAAGAQLAAAAPETVLAWALERFGPDDIALACSFGAEDVVLVDMLSRLRPEVLVFYLDTDLLFPETYETRDRIAARYPIRLVQYRPPLTVAEQAQSHGEALWRRSPNACCGIRKVEPLQRALAGLQAWVTGIRREQAPTRRNAAVVEWDQRWGLVKCNPLVGWTWKDVWDYIHTYGVPYNPLHDRGYPSIGCIHCTQVPAPGEDARAGRWSGMGKVECGLHGGD